MKQRIATDDEVLAPNKIAALPMKHEAVITLSDGTRLVLDEGWWLESGSALNERGEPCEIALVRADGARLTFAAKMAAASRRARNG